MYWERLYIRCHALASTRGCQTVSPDRNGFQENRCELKKTVVNRHTVCQSALKFCSKQIMAGRANYNSTGGLRSTYGVGAYGAQASSKYAARPLGRVDAPRYPLIFPCEVILVRGEGTAGFIGYLSARSDKLSIPNAGTCLSTTLIHQAGPLAETAIREGISPRE